MRTKNCYSKKILRLELQIQCVKNYDISKLSSVNQARVMEFNNFLNVIKFLPYLYIIHSIYGQFIGSTKDIVGMLPSDFMKRE